jgi:HK97 family phage major capsid protein
MKDINDLIQERGNIIEQMNAVLDTAEKEERDLNSDEQQKFDAMQDDQAALKKRIDNMKRVSDLESDINVLSSIPQKLQVKDGNPKTVLASDEYKQAFDSYARIGGAALPGQFLNALQVGTDSEGGYIVPDDLHAAIVEGLQDINEIRNYVTVIETMSDRNIPVESSLGSATWTAEEAAYTASDAAFGQTALSAYKLGTIIKVSEELLQDSAFDLTAYLGRNFGKRFGLAEETAFVNGAGTTQPTGITDGSTKGVDAASATAITSDELIDLYHSVGRPYRSNGTWIMNDSTVKLVRKLKDGDSQYLWQPGLQAGQPDMLLGRPVVASPGAEAATTGLKSVLFGDLSYYYVVDRGGVTMQRLNELYAANGQVGFRAYKRMDGKLTVSAAVKHILMA